MKRGYIITILGFAFVALCVGGCARRATLSDNELAQIFHDAFLANGYVTTESIRLDTLRLYDPIFEKYGYTAEDVQYSIGNFSMRKSARLSDVVERAIAMLERRGRELDLEVAILDTVNNIANRRAIERVYRDTSARRFLSLSDTTSLTIVIEPVERGSYKLAFDYLIDSLDSNRQTYYTKVWVEEDVEQINPEDSLTIEPLHHNLTSTSMQRRNVGRYSSKAIEVDDNASRLVAQLVSTSRGKIRDSANYSVTVKRVTIDYHPSDEDSQEWIYNKLLSIRVFDDELLFAPEP